MKSRFCKVDCPNRPYPIRPNMTEVSYLDDIPLSAHYALGWYWGRVYASLLENPKSKTWYIDDRANPKEFWKLLAIARPSIYLDRQGKKQVPKTYLPWVVKWLKEPEHREQVEELLREGDGANLPDEE